MNYPPCYIILAVPSLSILPPDVTGLVVPGLYPCKAVWRFPREAPVTGLLVPGLW